MIEEPKDMAEKKKAAAKKAVVSAFITTSPTKVSGERRATSIGSGSPSFCLGLARRSSEGRSRARTRYALE